MKNASSALIAPLLVFSLFGAGCWSRFSSSSPSSTSTSTPSTSTSTSSNASSTSDVATTPGAVVLPINNPPSATSTADGKGAVLDSWNEACNGSLDTYRVCVTSSHARQVIFQSGLVNAGDTRPDHVALKTWNDNASIYNDSGCMQLAVCSSDSLRWNAEFTSPNRGRANSEWFACSLYHPISSSFQVWKNGELLPSASTTLVQNSSPSGDGRNCQVK